MFIADGLCDLRDVGGGCDVCFVEGDIGGQSEIGLGDVEDDYSDAGFREIFHDLFADAAAAACEEDEFAGGIPARAARPVVQGPLREGLVDAADEAEGEEDAQGFLGEWVAQVSLRGFGDVRQGSLGVFLEEVEIGRHDGDGGSDSGGER